MSASARHRIRGCGVAVMGQAARRCVFSVRLLSIEESMAEAESDLVYYPGPEVGCEGCLTGQGS